MGKNRIFLLFLSLFLSTMLLIGCTKKEEKTIINIETNEEVSIKELSRNVDFGRRASSTGRDVLANNPGVTVGYVEVNDINPLNIGSYYVKGETIKEEGPLYGKPKPLFDVVILFAANIRWDRSLTPARPTIWFNDNWVSIMKDHAKYIQPLRDKGIKVLIDLLPDHDGVGYMNIAEDADIEYFTDIMLETFNKYQFDGYDMDEEYAAYHNRPAGKPGPSSVYAKKLFKRMREKLPKECMLTFFDYNGINTIISSNDDGQEIDFAYANYGGESYPGINGLSKRRYSTSSVHGTSSKQNNSGRARRAVTGESGGVLMHWNLREANELSASHLSGISEEFYGKPCEFDGKAYRKDWIKATTGRLVKKGE